MDGYTWEIHEMNIEVEITQHGIILSLDDSFFLLHKIYCSKLVAFNKYEVEKFRRYIIANDDCVYEKTFQLDYKI